jgi:hypothetical protein
LASFSKEKSKLKIEDRRLPSSGYSGGNFLRNVLGSSFLQNTGMYLLDYTVEIHGRLKHKSILHDIRLPPQI